MTGIEPGQSKIGVKIQVKVGGGQRTGTLVTNVQTAAIDTTYIFGSTNAKLDAFFNTFFLFSLKVMEALYYVFIT